MNKFFRMLTVAVIICPLLCSMIQAEPMLPEHKVIASDFELVYTDLPIPVNEAYKCYLITGLN